MKSHLDYAPFDPADYVDNPIALARIRAGITLAELAKRMNKTQTYINKIENRAYAAPQILLKVKSALKKED
jgi:transcriptional regulator with XRE-family HTH domain